MAKKPRKNSKKDEAIHKGVHFDLEEDAFEIFLRYLEEDVPPPDQPEEGTSEKRKKGSKRARKRQMPAISIDLHGYTLAEAIQHLESEIDWLRERHSGLIKLRIITGKGLHSGHKGGVLISEAYDYISKKFTHMIESIDDPPSKMKMGDIPLKGHFDVFINFGK